MTLNDPRDLQKLTRSFQSLFEALRDDLGWPIEADDLEDATFPYEPDELGINARYAAHIKTIKQLRPLVNNQAWGIFFVEFDQNSLPVMALRRILAALAVERRDRPDSLPVWKRADLLFVCQYTSAAEGKEGQRSVAFAYFHTDKDGKAELRTFSWDSRETHFYYLRRENLDALRWPKNDRDMTAWREQWRKAFTVRHQEVIGSSEKLASAMAKQARVIRDLVDDLYEAEGDSGALHRLLYRLQVDLIHDLDPKDFGDMIAQTITYGSFSAAEQHGTITQETLPDSIPDTNPLLKSMLKTLTSEGGLDLEELGVGQLIDMLNQTNVKAITRDFGRQTGSGSEDPVIHFYEQFLIEYDRAQRVQRGVFYTPSAVVQYIVKAVDQILQRPIDEGGFGIKDGLASDATINNAPDGQPLVQILDPATGTGTFLAHIIDHIKTAKRSLSDSAWNAYVANNLLKRLNGFELMMAPYTIAHLKLGLKLATTGYTFGTNERLRVFLTNALEEPVELTETLLRSDFLSQEASEAALVKGKAPIMVVIGNPPYSGHSANNIPEDWFKLRDYYFVDGQPLGEKNPKWLQDDYVKFIRFGQWRIEHKQNGEGILALITPHGYLDNPTFRGMRQHLMQSFDEIYVLNLHGNSRKREMTPDGSKDENVFDIMQGVAIGIFVKRRRAKGETKPSACVFHQHIWGIREDKYKWLEKKEIDTLGKGNGWELLEPQKPFYLFIPQNLSSSVEYQQGWKITDIITDYSMGVVTGQDSETIAIDRTNATGLAQKHKLPHTTVQEIAYRPFDTRYIVYDDSVVTRSRNNLMRNFLNTNTNIGLVTTRQVNADFKHLFCSNTMIDNCLTSTSTGERSYVWPLYRFPEANFDQRFDTSEWPLSDKGRRPNLSRAFVDQMAGKLGLSFVTDGRGDLHHTFGPEDVFHYAYAIFHSPSYRTRYAEQLKIDFPRLPLTTDVELFRQLVMRGVDLVALHLLEDDYQGTYWQRHREASPLSQPITTFVSGFNKNTVGAMSKSTAYDPKTKRISIDTSLKGKSSYFEFDESISPEDAETLWNFQIGGYQVLHKWLYDRKDRVLTSEDIAHYQRVVVALSATRSLMDEIDEVIAEHGGFPLAGSIETPEPSPDDDPVGAQHAAPDVDPDTDPSPHDEDDTMPDMNNTNADPWEGEVHEDENGIRIEPPPAAVYTSTELTTEVLETSLANTAGIEFEDMSSETSSEIQPFDPAQIRITTQSMSLDTILKRMRHNEINLSPDFQRMGGIWDENKMSRLIESLLIRIPLPAFYMDATDESDKNEWLVIDGLQRLTTLKRFIMPETENERLRLRGLEFWKEFEKKTYEDLPRHLQRRIEEAQVTVYLVEKGTPHNVKFNIFKRINTGGVPLAGQEIRHALNLGPVAGLLQELANSKEFKDATQNGVSPMRMTDRECVLRFLSFYIKDYSEYTSRDELDSFLNERMREINQMGKADPNSLDQLRAAFKQAMKRSERILGDNAFRKPPKNNRRSPISKALFEVWSVNLQRLSEDQFQKLVSRRRRLGHLFNLLARNQEFDTAISYSTGGASRVKTRFGEIARIIQEALADA